MLDSRDICYGGSTTIVLPIRPLDLPGINVVVLYPWLLLPVVPVMLVVLAFNFFGDGLRDAADPYK